MQVKQRLWCLERKVTVWQQDGKRSNRTALVAAVERGFTVAALSRSRNRRLHVCQVHSALYWPLAGTSWNTSWQRLQTKASVATKLRRSHAKCRFACFRAPTPSMTELFKMWMCCAWSHAAGKNQSKGVTACISLLTRQAHWPSSGPPDRPFRPISEQ